MENDTASGSGAVPERLTSAELRTLFLFESLGEDQLDFLSERGWVKAYSAGTEVYREGEAATCFFVLLDGSLVMSLSVEGTDLELIRSDQRGVYAGATAAFVSGGSDQTYRGSVTAVTDCTFWVIDADIFGQAFRGWFPMATHLLEGMMLGLRNSQTIVAQRERLLALGRMSAGLTHELNNPAAAAVRATASLRERVAKMRQKLAKLANADIDPEALELLTTVQDAALERLAKAPKRTAMQLNDAEDELSDWLTDRGIDDGWEIAPTLAAAGLDSEWLDTVTASIPADLLPDGLRWVNYAVETEMLMSEIEDSTHRISALVGAAKQYSQMDRAPSQDIDVRDGIDSTLVMLAHKFEKFGVSVEKRYDETLPLIPAHPGELNQVWTNLIDNAVSAMKDAGGVLTITTGRAYDNVVVEIADTGTGIPAEVQGRIFEPFFTTKPVGEGTGLGLDISYRIVTRRHHGDLSVTSEPGNTRFRVQLPIHNVLPT